MNIEIYFSEDSELIELETAQRGVRGDVLIKYMQRFYDLEFMTIERLNSEYYYSKQFQYVFTIDNTIVVDCLSKSRIIETILQLGENYFDTKKSVDMKARYGDRFQSIDSWVRVY